MRIVTAFCALNYLYDFCLPNYSLIVYFFHHFFCVCFKKNILNVNRRVTFILKVLNWN